MDKEKELSIEFPEGFVSALSRRHNGAKHTQKEIYEVFSTLKILKEDWDKWKARHHKLLYVDWDEKEIEKHFREPIWYNAHRRLKSYEEMLSKLHRKMFHLLTNFDGNGGESFSSFGCISVEEIYSDFKEKYIDNPSDVNIEGKK